MLLVDISLVQGFATDRMIFRDDELSYALGRISISRSRGILESPRELGLVAYSYVTDWLPWQGKEGPDPRRRTLKNSRVSGRCRICARFVL